MGKSHHHSNPVKQNNFGYLRALALAFAVSSVPAMGMPLQSDELESYLAWRTLARQDLQTIVVLGADEGHLTYLLHELSFPDDHVFYVEGGSIPLFGVHLPVEQASLFLLKGFEVIWKKDNPHGPLLALASAVRLLARDKDQSIAEVIELSSHSWSKSTDLLFFLKESEDFESIAHLIEKMSKNNPQLQVATTGVWHGELVRRLRSLPVPPEFIREYLSRERHEWVPSLMIALWAGDPELLNELFENELLEIPEDIGYLQDEVFFMLNQWNSIAASEFLGDVFVWASSRLDFEEQQFSVILYSEESKKGIAKQRETNKYFSHALSCLVAAGHYDEVSDLLKKVSKEPGTRRTEIVFLAAAISASRQDYDPSQREKWNNQDVSLGLLGEEAILLQKLLDPDW